MTINTYPIAQLASSCGTRTPDFNWDAVSVRGLWAGAVVIVSNSTAKIENVVGVVASVDFSGRSPVVVYTNGNRAKVATAAKLCVARRYGRKAAWLEASDLVA